MIWTYLLAMLIIFGLLAGWIGVQHLYREFARRHPEFGPAREEGGGCGFMCFCKNRDSCRRNKPREPDMPASLRGKP
jgi:hypothetical protein